MGINTKKCSIAAAIALAFSGQALAVEQNTNGAETDNVEKIVVTGSRIKRTDIEGVAPVTVISAAEIEMSGLSSISEILQSSVANNGATFDGDEGSGFTQGASSINLRGMGANRTLVLVNGHRQPIFPAAAGGSSNFIDVSTIPSAAVERIEILTGGASAIYGSDAVGGVVNIILKKSYEGGEFDVKFENPQHGGRDVLKTSFTYGFETDNTHTLAILEYKDSEELQYYQRELTQDLGPYGGNTWSSWGAWLADYSKVYHGDKYIRPTWEECQDILGDKAREVPTSSYSCRYDDNSDRGLHSAYEEISLILNHMGKLNENWDYFALVQASQKDNIRYKDEKGFGAYVYEDRDTGALSLESSEFDSYNRYQIRRRMEEFPGQRTYDSVTKKYSVLAGVEGAIGDYNAELSFSYGKNEYTRDSNHQILAQSFLDTVTFDPNDADTSKWYPLRPMTDEQVAAMMVTGKQWADSSIAQVQAVIDGELFELPGGVAEFAVTTEWASESYEDKKDDNLINGKLIGLGGTQGEGERDRYAIAAELALPLVADTEWAKSLDLSIAVRYDYYNDDSDVGGAATPQIGLKYSPNNNMLVRASWGQSFRAPDMHRLYAGLTRAFSSTSIYIDPNHPTDISDQYESYTEGTLTLEEETGDYWNLGLVAQVTDNLDLTFDFWGINLEGAVRTESIDRMLGKPSEYDLTGKFTSCRDIRGLGYITALSEDGSYRQIECIKRGYINSAEESSQGADVSLSYKLETQNDGDFRFKLSASYLDEKLYQQYAGEEKIDATEHYYIPKWKVNGSVSWKVKSYTTTLSAYYTGSQQGSWENDDDEVVFDKLGSYLKVNWTNSYRINKTNRIGFGINNLTDEMPPIYPADNPYRNSDPYYDTSNGYNAVGRTFYASYQYKF